MKSKVSLLFGVSMLVVVLADSAFALRKPAERQDNPLIRSMMYYSLPKIDGGDSDINMPNIDGKPINSASMQSSSHAPSPGVAIANTMYEHQSNGSIKRQVQISQHAPGDAIIHFDWMYAPDAVNAATGVRTLRYNAYHAISGTMTSCSLSDPIKRTGYVVGDVIPTNGNYLAVGHQFQSGYTGNVQLKGWWQSVPGTCSFVELGLPDGVADDPSAGTGSHFAWPACAYQQFAGQFITHILAHEQYGGQIKYFRKVGTGATGTWTMGLVLDTANNLGYDIYASKTTGKILLGWIANVVAAGDPCDTCSQSAALYSQADNDVYVKMSTNAGATWGQRKNITKNVDGVSGHRPYWDLSVMIDESDQAILAWPARQWPADANSNGVVSQDRCRIDFWRESFSPGVIRTVAALDYDQTDCDGGAFKMNAGRIQIARCNSRTYVLWEQFNDANAGIMGDCASRAYTTGPTGAANSDLYVSISEDNGLTWDPARNITNTRTPGCDSATGVGGACQSEVYPTLTPFGHNLAGNYGAQVPVPIPGSAGTNNGYHLECQYILDRHAGAAIRQEGPWFLANVMWMRIECDMAIQTPVFTIKNFRSIDYPAYVKHGFFRDTNFTFENSGNQTLSFTVAKYETTGPSGWLTFSGFTGTVFSGLNNTQTGQFRLNSGGIVNAPGTVVRLRGGVVFTHNGSSSPDTIPITCYVTDTIIPPNWDTITVTSATKASNRKSLTVSNNGGFGNAGRGNVNLDFAEWNDCDPNATVYLYDGSVVVGYVTGPDTNMFFNIYQTNWLAENGLRPVKGPKAMRKKACPAQNFNLVYTGKFTTSDSNITMEKTWYAPILESTGTNDSAWIIQNLKVYNTSGATINSAVIGEAADFDIPSDVTGPPDFAFPSDKGVSNSAGFDVLRKLIYQQGVESNDSNECQNNDLRFGGVRYLGGFKNASAIANFSSAYADFNSIYVYPNGTFDEQELFTKMQTSGYYFNDESLTDLHIVMTFVKNQTFLVSDTFKFSTAWLTVRNGDATALFTMADRALGWFTAKGISGLSDTNCVASCCLKEGDFNHDGATNVVDLSAYVAFLFQSGPIYVCKEEADVDDNDAVNVVDLVKVVAFLFQGGSIGTCP